MEKYYRHLSRVQNSPEIGNIIDIMTITGLMDIKQKKAHLLRYAELVKDIDAIEYCKNN